MSWKGDGLWLEADPRHREILIRERDQTMRVLGTPGVKNQQRKDMASRRRQDSAE